MRVRERRRTCTGNTIPTLTEARIGAAKPTEKPYKLRDGRGLHLLQPTGSRLWRLRYRYAGRESMLGLGAYPDVTLKMARDRCGEARQLIAAGIDPAAARRAERTARENTFAAIAHEWLGKQQLAPITRRKAEGHFKFVLPHLGSRPIAEIESPEVLAVLRRIESTGHLETVHRVKQRIGHVGALTFVRPGELRKAAWSEFDLDSPEPTWRIPGPRMKMKELHIVPLCTQAVAILRGIPEPAKGGIHGVVAYRASRGAQRREYKRSAGDEMTAHGFRSTASTLLNEQGWHPDLIELQLAHAERNKVRAAYNRAERLAERRKMMQAWGDYLDGLRAGSNVVPIRRSAA